MATSAVWAGGAYAAEGKLRLLSNGEPVRDGQPSAVYNEAQFPGFTCQGTNGSMSFETNPARTLKFGYRAEGGSYGFDSCKTTSGEGVPISSRSEGNEPHLRRTTITTTTVTEIFRLAPIFEDRESGCVWTLPKLAGPLPSSGSLEGVLLSGTLRLLKRYSSRTCPQTAEVRDTTTIEAAPEGAPPGSYEVQRIE